MTEYSERSFRSYLSHQIDPLLRATSSDWRTLAAKTNLTPLDLQAAIRLLPEEQQPSIQELMDAYLWEITESVSYLVEHLPLPQDLSSPDIWLEHFRNTPVCAPSGFVDDVVAFLESHGLTSLTAEARDVLRRNHRKSGSRKRYPSGLGPQKVVDRVLERLNKLAVQPQYPFSDVVQAIEMRHTSRIRVIYRPSPASFFGDSLFSVALHQDVAVAVHGARGSFGMREVFLYYPVDCEPLKTRFAIAHELGHLFLHWGRGEPSCVSLGATASEIYLQEFNSTQEMEADTFACILCEQRPAQPARAFDYPREHFLRECVSQNLLPADFTRAMPVTRSLDFVPEFLGSDPRGVLRTARSWGGAQDRRRHQVPHSPNIIAFADDMRRAACM